MPEEKEGTPDVGDELKDKDGKHPETVSWGQYVGIKESLGNKLATASQKVESLEGQLKERLSTEEHGKLKTELDEAKTKLTTTEDELKTTKEATLTEKRAVLVKRGISEDEAKNMSVEQINGAIKVLETYKPKADLGSGGGAQELKGSPMELARQAYEKK